MAEERLMDDDKDKKYIIRKNENGEEELVLNDGLQSEEDEEAEEVSFEVPQSEEDDEEAAVMTPEQLAAKMAEAQKEKEEKAKKLADLINSARNDIEKDNYSTALESLTAAEDLDDENGEIKALKLVAYTRNFTDYTQIEKAAEDVDGVKKYTSKEQKNEMLTLGEKSIKQKIGELTYSVNKLSEENEQKKSERAVKFNADNKKSIIAFVCTLVPFAVVLALAIWFSTVIFSSQDGLYLILTIVFGALSVVGLIALAFAARRLSITARRVRLNKKDTSTKLGRQLIAEEAKLAAFNAVYSALVD
jgi:hypothetical protein